MLEVNGCNTKNFNRSPGVGSHSNSVRFRLRSRLGPVLAVVASVALATACGHRIEPPAAVLPSGTEYRLEIAADDVSRARGYMFREYVGPNDGMLFLFDQPGRHSFWMKNCKVSLDIIWLDQAAKVTEIAHDLQPCPAEGPCENVFPMREAAYVLELAGGTARRQGLKLGDSVELYLEESAGR